MSRLTISEYVKYLKLLFRTGIQYYYKDNSAVACQKRMGSGHQRCHQSVVL